MPVNEFFPESSLGSCIGTKKGGGGRGSGSASSKNFFKLSQYNSWNQMPYKERSLWKICNKIHAVCKKNNLPPIIANTASEFYNSIKDINMSRGNPRQGLIAACVYAACKDADVPRSDKEIASYFGIDIEIITNGIKRFREIWRISGSTNEKINSSPSNPLHYIGRYCSNLDLNNKVKYISEFVAIKAVGEGLVTSNTAPSIAAGSIYFVCQFLKIPISKKDIKKACLTSEVTVSKCYDKLNKCRNILIPLSIQQEETNHLVR